MTHRTSGVLVADRQGTSNAYGLFNLQERADLFIGAGEDVYEGMVIGENSRPGDMDVNATKEKKLTNIRTHAHDEALRLTPPRPLTLESAIRFSLARPTAGSRGHAGVDPNPQADPLAARSAPRAGQEFDLPGRGARLAEILSPLIGKGRGRSCDDARTPSRASARRARRSPAGGGAVSGSRSRP